MALRFVVASSPERGGQDEAGEEETAPLIDDVAEENGGGPQALGSDDDTTFGGDPNFPPSDEHTDADQIAELFSGSAGQSGEFAVYYTTDAGVIRAGSDGLAQPEVQTAATLTQVIGFPLINDGGRTWAVDRDRPGTVFLVSTRFVAVDSDLGGSVAFVDPRGGTTSVGVSYYGGWRPGIEVPPGSQVLPISGRGLLITPPTGGTFAVGGTGNLSRISDDQVVAAATGAEVYRRCDDSLVCELYAMVSDREGNRIDREIPLDISDSDSVSVSPNGRFVASFPSEPGPITIIETETGETATLNGDEVAQAWGWAPDSSFLAHATADELILTQPFRDSVGMPIPAAPVAPQLLVVKQQPG